MQQLRAENTPSCVGFYGNAAVLKLSLGPPQSLMQPLHCPGCHANSCHYESRLVLMSKVGGGQEGGVKSEGSRPGVPTLPDSKWTQMNPISEWSLC